MLDDVAVDEEEAPAEDDLGVEHLGGHAAKGWQEPLAGLGDPGPDVGRAAAGPLGALGFVERVEVADRGVGRPRLAIECPDHVVEPEVLPGRRCGRRGR